MSRRPAARSGPAANDESAPGVAVESWLARQGLRARSVRTLAGDVSSRSYFRVELEGEAATWIAVCYPAELAAAQRRFAAARSLLDAGGLRVPAIRLDDPEAGFSLVEDLGPATLHETIRSWEEAPAHLAAALRAVVRIAGLPVSGVEALASPPLGAELLRQELASTQELLTRPAGIDTPAFDRALDGLCLRLGRALVPCHRDLMARNLVPMEEGGEMGVLDFQDLRLGPPGYDLASMLNDTLFAEAATEAAALAELGDVAGGLEQYRAAVVQRALKAVGTFLRFARRGRRRHLRLVRPTLERALRLFPLVPETAPLGEEFVAAVRAAGEAAAVC